MENQIVRQEQKKTMDNNNFDITNTDEVKKNFNFLKDAVGELESSSLENKELV